MPMTIEQIIEANRTLEGLCVKHIVALLQSNEDLLAILKDYSFVAKSNQNTNVTDFKLIYPCAYLVNLTSVLEGSVYDVGRPSEQVFDMFHFGVFAVSANSRKEADALAEYMRVVLTPSEQVVYDYDGFGQIHYCSYVNQLPTLEPLYNGRRTYQVGHKFELLAQRAE